MKTLKYKADIYKTLVTSKGFHYRVIMDRVTVGEGYAKDIQEALATVD